MYLICYMYNATIKLSMNRFKDKPCQNCSQLFEPRSSNDKWCPTCRTKTCDYCGNEYLVDSPSKIDSQKFCKKCKTFTCKTCGKTFTITQLRDRESIKYCSRDCLIKGRNPRVSHICEKCGKEFISTSGRSAMLPYKSARNWYTSSRLGQRNL
jgi:hypothetical protein